MLSAGSRRFAGSGAAEAASQRARARENKQGALSLRAGGRDEEQKH